MAQPSVEYRNVMKQFKTNSNNVLSESTLDEGLFDKLGQAGRAAASGAGKLGSAALGGISKGADKINKFGDDAAASIKNKFKKPSIEDSDEETPYTPYEDPDAEYVSGERDSLESQLHNAKQGAEYYHSIGDEETAEYYEDEIEKLERKNNNLDGYDSNDYAYTDRDDIGFDEGVRFKVLKYDENGEPYLAEGIFDTLSQAGKSFIGGVKKFGQAASSKAGEFGRNVASKAGGTGFGSKLINLFRKRYPTPIEDTDERDEVYGDDYVNKLEKEKDHIDDFIGYLDNPDNHEYDDNPEAREADRAYFEKEKAGIDQKLNNYDSYDANDYYSNDHNYESTKRPRRKFASLKELASYFLFDDDSAPITENSNHFENYKSTWFKNGGSKLFS